MQPVGTRESDVENEVPGLLGHVPEEATIGTVRGGELLTRTSMRPNRARTSATKRSAAAALPTSPTIVCKEGV